MKLWIACALLLVAGAFGQVASPKIAVFTNGDVSDVGWSFEVNTGRVAMETALSIDSSTLVPNIVTTDQAVSALSYYASQGYQLLMTTTVVFVAAIAQVCSQYPKVMFVQANNVKPNCTNVVRVNWSNYQPYYLMGYYAGLMTTNNQIGMVVPGDTVNKPNTINSFYAGMARANPNAKLWAVATATYLDADRESGASDILLNQYNVTVLCQNQDDFTVPIKAMDAGLLAIGTTGFPLHQTYGQKVGISFIMDWSLPFIHFASQIINGTWDGQDIAATLNNQMFKLDVFSFRVPQSVQAAVMDQYHGILNGSVQIVCSANGTANAYPCMTNNETNAYQWFPQITLITTYYVPTTEVSQPSGLVGVIAALTAICALFVFICMVITVIFREAEVIRSASPTFLLLMCIGAFMLYASVLLRLPSATEQLCSASVWLLSLGFTFLFGHLVAKNYRIWRIFDDPLVDQVVIKNWQLMSTVGVLLAINIALLAAWQGAGSPDSRQDFGQNNDPYSYLSVCTENSDGDALLYTLLAFHGILAVFGCFLAFRTRVIPPQFAKFKESVPIMYAIYDVAFCSCVVVPIMFLLPDAVTRVAVLCLAELFATTAAIGVIFMPKIWSLVREGPDHQSGALGTRSGTGSGSAASVGVIEVHN